MSQTLYFGGPIVTMERELYVQALLTEGERILYAGSLHGAEERAEGTVRRVDLKGRALLPAFVDAHSHLTAYANTFLQAGLGECAGWEELGRRLSAFAAREGLAPGEWVRGEGYDHNELAEGRHPARQLLDAACPGHPVMIQHRSGHVGVFNTLALERLGVNEETPCPPGGRMERGPDGKLTGYMEENAFLQLQKRVPLPDTEDLLAAYDKAQRSYASYGVATVQEGMMPDQLIPLYRQLLERDLLWLDVVGYADADGQAAEAFSGHIRAYSGHFKLGGYKIFLDGSPQGRTAWMRTPYLGGGPQDRGYPVLTDRQVYDRMALALDQGMQLLAHCNGDAAADQLLRVYEAARDASDNPEKMALRPVMIHAQTARTDQYEKMAAIGMIPSIFSSHVWYWGDAHLRNLGPVRGGRVSACGDAERAGLPFTLHTDTPVLRPNLLEAAWCAVNRITKAGVQLDEDQKVTPYEAMRAITYNGAYQYGEEADKGTLEAGKLADLVVLDRNPLAVDPREIRDIQVLATIKEGDTLYERDAK